MPLKKKVRAVAERRIAGILAAAKQCRFSALCREHHGLDAGARVRAVAEWLLLAPAAPAPRIALAGLELDLIGAELRPFRLLRHDHSLYCPVLVLGAY